MEKLKKLILIEDVDANVIEVNKEKIVKPSRNSEIKSDAGNSMIAVRKSHEFQGLALYLSIGYEWTMGKDKEGLPILVATRKY